MIVILLLWLLPRLGVWLHFGTIMCLRCIYISLYGASRAFFRVPYLAFGTWHIPLFGCWRHYFPVGHLRHVENTRIVPARVHRMRHILQLPLDLVGFVDLDLCLVHLSWEILRVTFGLFLLNYSIILRFVPVEQIKHVIEFCRSDSWPNNDFFPVSKASTVVEWRNWEPIVHMLQFFLRGQCILNEVRVKAEQAKDENAED